MAATRLFIDTTTERWRRLSPEIRGIFLVVGGMLALSLLNAMNKYLTAFYLPVQVVWLRFLFTLPLIVFVVLPRYGPAIVKTRRPWLQALRSLLFAVQMTLTVSAFALLPLADAQALLLTSPLFVMALSWPLLREQVGRARCIAVAIGFCGAMIIIQPGLARPELAMMIALLAAFMFAMIQFLTRVVGRTDLSMTTFALQILGVALILSLAAPLFAEPIALRHLPAFMIIALLGAIGHFCLIMALTLAPAAVIQPFTYLVIIYAFIIGYVAFGEIPSLATIIGGLIIASAGIFALRHEQRRSGVRLKE